MLVAKHVAILLAGLSLAAHGSELAPQKAALPAKPVQPDLKFLEYLGTAEGDDENWTDVETAAAIAASKASVEAMTAKPVAERK